MYQVVRFVLIATLVIYLIIGALLYFFQRSFIYFPSVEVAHSFEEIVFESGDEKIKVLKLNGESDKVILYFGGNAESVSYTARDFETKLISHSIYLMNYRGYGGSSGFPNEAGLYADALKLYDLLALKNQDIYVVGRSLGSGVATYLASNRAVKKLILITPFDSIERVAQKQFPYYPMPFLLKDKFDSAARATKIKSDVLIISAENDKIITQARTEKLIESLNKKRLKTFVINQAGHNDISDNKQFYDEINDFLK